jgi:ubiquinone/menaquinone biosynthesis C-methylase UbiE
MPLSVDKWHRRFEIQSQWTNNARDYLFQRVDISCATHVLDVGCGTGVLSRELTKYPIPHVVGIDINNEFIDFAASIATSARFVIADANQTPMATSSFDFTMCHYLLMWIEDPLAVLYEMKRVTKPGGSVMVLAEPDYGGRIDYPEPLTILNEWQTAALQNQGADPYIGRKMRALFHQAGFIDIEVGVIGAQWKGEVSNKVLNSEWEIIQSDLETLDHNNEIFPTWGEIQKIDFAAWQTGERIIYVPTFYGLGRIDKN